MAKLIDIEGIGPKYAERLKEAGVTTLNALLELGSTAKGRRSIAEKAGISESLVLRWVNHIDLFRIKGVGEEYADLLEQAGVDSIVELAQRKAQNLYDKMTSMNQQNRLVRKMPNQEQVKD